MYDWAILWEWLAFALRWLHVITAIAWIGSSFYFVALDLGLDRDVEGPADGEAWQVHGGGFYHIRKYLVAPEALPEHLTWFKWESYATWLSGAALLMVVYWAGAELFLIDPVKAELAPWQGAAISAGFIAAGWLGYDALCRSRLRSRPWVVMAVLMAGIVVASWALNQIFTGRAALLHLGAMTATIMSANVFAVIMPNQRIVVADLKAGRRPDPEYGRIAKLRSTHNNYLTLPVVFLMLSNHYPLAHATPHAWAIAALVFVIGVLIRHFFNSLHAGRRPPGWTWAAALMVMLAIAWLSSPRAAAEDGAGADLAPRGAELRYRQAEGFDRVAGIVQGRCSMCHAREPVWEGLHWAPGGVLLETPAEIAREAQRIYLQAGISHAMPPANLTGLEAEERAAIRAWFRAARAAPAS